MAPLNGSITLSTDRLSVTYNCDVGSTLSGTYTQICQPGGSNWNGLAPTCGIYILGTFNKNRNLKGKGSET